MKQDSKIVITGIGIVSPLGNNIKDFWEGLINGKSGIKKIKRFDVSDLPTKIAGEIDDFDPLKYMDEKTVAISTRFTQLAIAAVKQAVEDANIQIDESNREKIGIYVGSGLCSLFDVERAIIASFKKGGGILPFITAIKNSNHSSAYTIACNYGIKGPAYTISSVCNSSCNALEIASDQIKLNKISKAIIIGVDELGEFEFRSLCFTKSMSTNNSNPKEACRPFDKDRDGFVAAEGAGAIVLEKKREAFNRGIKPYAALEGSSSTNDGYDIVRCEPEGHQISKAMKIAIDRAKIDKGDITHIYTHGPGMRDTDKAETTAIKRLFGNTAYKLQTPSIKGAIGSPIGATNITQIIAGCLSFRDKVIPPTINYKKLDPDCDLDYVPCNAREGQPPILLINSHAYGGGNASVVLRRT